MTVAGLSLGSRTIFRWSAGTIAIGNPPSNLLVPLFLASSPQETNDDHSHVVTPNTASLGIGGQAVVHHILADFVQILLGSDASADELDDGLGRLAVPDAYSAQTCQQNLKGCDHETQSKPTVACDHQKFIIVGKLVDDDVGVCRDNLLLGSKLCALLEFEIANGTGEGQVAVDPTKIDETAGSGNSCLLTYRRQNTSN